MSLIIGAMHVQLGNVATWAGAVGTATSILLLTRQRLKDRDQERTAQIRLVVVEAQRRSAPSWHVSVDNMSGLPLSRVMLWWPAPPDLDDHLARLALLLGTGGYEHEPARSRIGVPLGSRDRSSRILPLTMETVEITNAVQQWGVEVFTLELVDHRGERWTAEVTFEAGKIELHPLKR